MTACQNDCLLRYEGKAWPVTWLADHYMSVIKKKKLIYHSPDITILWSSFLHSCLTSVAQEGKWWPKSFVFSISMITISILICYNHYVDFCLIPYGPNLFFIKLVTSFSSLYILLQLKETCLFQVDATLLYQ